MGIHGLTSFIQKYYDKHKEKIYLRDCPVVIDGCNLMFFLYFYWRQVGGINTSSSTSSPRGGGGSPLTKSSPLKHPHLFGGDYLTYAQNVREFFQHLKLCGIMPIVIFDGAYDDLKIKTAVRRFQENVKENVKSTSGMNTLKGVMPGSSYSPVFMKVVFVEILEEQKILHYQTEQEADCTIAFVARQLNNCPILSSDSDFHIYVDSVVLPLHTLMFKRVTPVTGKPKGGMSLVNTFDDSFDSPSASPSKRGSKIWTLHSQYVSLSSLCQKEFGLNDSRFLPLAAIILGNDWIRTATFSRFQSTTAGGERVKRNSRIAFLLRWLGKQKSLEGVVRTMLINVRESQRERTQILVNEIIAIYTGLRGEDAVWKKVVDSGQVAQFPHADTSTDVNELEELVNLKLSLDDKANKENSSTIFAVDESTENISDDEEDEDNGNDGDKEHRADSEDVEYNFWTLFEDGEGSSSSNNVGSTSLPAWYLDKHMKCYFSTYLLKIVKNQMVFLSPQVEISSLPSTHVIAYRIIQVLGGIMLGPEKKNLTLITRQRANFVEISIPILTYLENYGQLPFLYNGEEFRKALSPEKRSEIILDTLDLCQDDFVDFVNEWPVSLRIWIVSLTYFLKSSVATVDKEDQSPTTLIEANVRKVSLSVTISLLLAIIKNVVLNPSGASKSKDDDVVSMSTLLNQTSPSTLSKLKLFYAKFECSADSGATSFKKNYDISHTYNVSTYTCLLFHLQNLNRLLGDPFKAPRINCNLNTWLVFNLSTKLASNDALLLEDAESPSSWIGQEVAECVSSLCDVQDMGLIVERFLSFVK